MILPTQFLTYISSLIHTDCPLGPPQQNSCQAKGLLSNSKITLTAKIKPISKQSVITQMRISRLFLFSDLTRLESLYTPHTPTHPHMLTHVHGHLHTRTTPLEKGSSSKSSHLTLYWNNRSVWMEKTGLSKAHPPNL